MVLLGRPNKEWFSRNWYRVLVHLGALLPLGWLLWHYVQGLFLVDPVREVTTITGRTALILLLLSLACTPIGLLTGLNQVLRVRRALGVYAFLYAGLHFLTFVGLDYGFDLEILGPAIFDQPYVLVGFAAGVILLVLAATSTKGWKRRLKRNWKRLHRLVYLVGPIVVVHFLWLSKDDRLPWRYGAILAALLVLRFPPIRRAISRLRHWLRVARAPGTTTDILRT
jgi:sulfoxide reductase heme-binding subunit YedZ